MIKGSIVTATFFILLFSFSQVSSQVQEDFFFGMGEIGDITIETSHSQAINPPENTLNQKGYKPNLNAASRFLSKATLGYSYEDIEEAADTGIEDWVKIQLNKHGMGFSNFFKTILGKDSIILPLFAFNIGVEIAQIIIVIICISLSWLVVVKLKLNRKFWIWSTSSIIALWSLSLILERI